jgi:hypothetical protein
MGARPACTTLVLQWVEGPGHRHSDRRERARIGVTSVGQLVNAARLDGNVRDQRVHAHGLPEEVCTELAQVVFLYCGSVSLERERRLKAAVCHVKGVIGMAVRKQRVALDASAQLLHFVQQLGTLPNALEC